MKKFAKGCLIIAGVLFIVGFLICLITYTIGGPYLTSNLLNSRFASSISLLDISKNNYVNAGNSFNKSYQSDYPIYSLEREDHQAALSQDVSNLYLSIGAGDCYLEESPDEYFHIDFKGDGQIQYYVQNGTFYVNGFQIEQDSSNNYHNKVTIRIPESSFDTVTIDVGASQFKCESLSCDNITISLGAGSMKMETLLTEYADIDVGAGDITITDGKISDCTMNVGMGSIQYSGVISHDLSASCEMGNIDFSFKDTEDAHNYDVSCSLGTIELDSRFYSGIDFNEYINHKANSTYTLDCSLGSIEVSF